MISVEVLIPHSNRAEGLRRTLESLRAQSVSCDVCVIDNASTDHTSEVLAGFPEIRHLRLDRNVGFGTAINHGARTSSARLLILLNNDAVADHAMVEEMIAVQANSGAAMVAGCLRSPGGEVETMGVDLDQSLMIYDHSFRADYERVRDRPPAPPLAPCGGLAAFLREPFLASGGFDERIFAYVEDVELGVRMRASGHECVVAPRAFAWHEHSATLGARSAAKNELLSWGRGYLLWKHGARLSVVALARGAALDAAVIAGKALIDRDLGALRGRLRFHRERRLLEPSARAGAPPAGLLKLSLREALGRRLARRRS